MNDEFKKEVLVSNLKIIIDGINQIINTNKDHHILSIANSIRTICHDSNNSRSILNQLNLLETDFYSPQGTGDDLRNKTVVLAWPMIKIQETRHEETIDISTIPNGICHNDKLIPFNKWWTEPVVVQNGNILGRKQIILQTTNKLGGAHLDIETQSQAFRTFKEQSVLFLGIQSLSTNEHDENIFPLMIYKAHIIQIAIELVISLRKVISEINEYL